MQSDYDLQTTLSKWPFILGDVLLVATALAIAILGHWQLSNWQVAACVASVALGAALFVLPYVVEFKVRVREEAEDRGADLRVLQRHLVNTQDQLEAVSERIEGIEGSLTHLAALQAQVADWPVQISETPESKAASDSEPELKARKTREPRQRRKSEPRLFNRAIEQKRDHASAAVSRIIEAKNKKQPEGEVQAVLAGEEPPARAEAKAGPPAEEPESELEVKSDSQSKTAPAEKTSEESDGEPPASETEDMFAEAVPPQVAKRTRTKKSDTAVIASVFIGIGNKPFIRGSGANLSWESGVAMEFEEIGKWRWIAPAELEAPVEIQLYRNDEDPDSTGQYTLEPGQRLDLSPVF